jgi:hypothetical protein
MDEATNADTQEWTGCVAGALTEQEFTDALTAADLGDIEIRRAHRVHGSAVRDRARTRAGGALARMVDEAVAAPVVGAAELAG